MDERIPNAEEIARRDAVADLAKQARGITVDRLRAASLLAQAVEAVLSPYMGSHERQLAEQLGILLRLDDGDHRERRLTLDKVERIAEDAWLESMRDEEAEQDEEADRRFYQRPRPFNITGRFG